MKYLLCLFFLFAAACSQNFNGGQAEWYCGMILKEKCTSHHVHERCGTNGITYRNMCALGQAHCHNNNTNQLHEGSCLQTGSTTTTRNPQDVVHGSQIILDQLCILLSRNNCVSTMNEKICATDAITYKNFCEYEKSRCMHRELHVAMLGDCNA